MNKVKSEEANVRISQELCIREALQKIVAEAEMILYISMNTLSAKNVYYLKSLVEHTRDLIHQKDDYMKSMYSFYEITKVYRFDEM